MSNKKKEFNHYKLKMYLEYIINYFLYPCSLRNILHSDSAHLMHHYGITANLPRALFGLSIVLIIIQQMYFWRLNSAISLTLLHTYSIHIVVTNRNIHTFHWSSTTRKYMYVCSVLLPKYYLKRIMRVNIWVVLLKKWCRSCKQPVI